MSASVSLALTPPFAVAPALGNLRAHAIPGSEVIDGDSYTRLLPLAAGSGGTGPVASGPLAVTVTLAADAVLATIDSDDDTEVAAAVEALSAWLDLGHDPRALGSALAGDPVIGPLIRARPGLRVLGSLDGFETAIMTVLGQQISLAAARTFGGRLVAAFGEPGPAGLRSFPRPQALAAVEPERLQAAIGLTGARARTVHALARACAEGLELSAGASPAEFRAELLALPGIGPWTVDYLSVRVLGDRDAFVPGDLVLRRALSAISGQAVDAKQAAVASEAWRPYRAYALLHLWSSAAYD